MYTQKWHRLVWALALVAAVLCASGSYAAVRRVTVSNAEPRRDAVDGSIIDVHDGCLERFGDRYYLYGTAYGNTDGFGPTNRYVCYSSPDLVSWTYHGDLLRNAPAGVYYRPYVKFNSKTRQYVLWYNWYPTLWDGQFGVATSEKPEGPFTIRETNAKVRNPRPGDHGLFVDDDGTGYLAYTSIGLGHGIAVEKLNDDYLSSSMECSEILSAGCEAPAMIKRNGTYYVFFDSCCCFCPQGSGARVYVSKSPLGPYSHTGNINRTKDGSPVIAAQQTHVAQIHTPSGIEYIWMGDRWESRPDGIKGHDFQYWSSPLRFAEDGTIEPLKWEDQWSVDLPIGADPTPLVRLEVDRDKPGSIRFWGSEAAELFSRQIAESFAGVLRKNYVSQPDSGFPPGFLHASPIPQGWSGTFWTRDGGTFLRELVQWGHYERACLTAECLMKLIAPNEDGYYTCPEFFRGWQRDTGHEFDGTTSVIIGMVLLWERLPAANPFRERIYNFLHQEYSPVRYLLARLAREPLIPGSGEFGGGCTIPGLHYNVVPNNLAVYALTAAANMEDSAGERKYAGQLRRAAWTLRRNIEKYLVDSDGGWIWCIDPATLQPNPDVVNHIINKGFGGLNGPACMYSDVMGFDPVGSGWWGAKPSTATFDKLFAVPTRKEQFEKWGIWAQFDEFRGGCSSGPAYGDGYAVQTMLLYDRLDMAARCLGWVASSTFSPIPEYTVDRESPYHFYEQSYTPDAVGRTGIGQGCGALNLVSVTEPLKAARLILGVDDTSTDAVRILPRLPESWKGVEAKNWPIRTSAGMARADIRFERSDRGCAFSLEVTSGGPVPRLMVRAPSSGGWTWRTAEDVIYTRLHME